MEVIAMIEHVYNCKEDALRVGLYVQSMLNSLSDCKPVK